MVALLIENGGNSCGIAYVMTSPSVGFEDWAYQVTDRGCGGKTFAHEHGHNMGFEHDPANSARAGGGASYDWSFAHFVSGSFRTIMSYSNQCVGGCPRALRFSNPDIFYNIRARRFHSGRRPEPAAFPPSPESGLPSPRRR